MVLWEKICHGALGEESYAMVVGRRDVVVLWRKVLCHGALEKRCHSALREVMSWCFGRRDVMVLWEKRHTSWYLCFGE